MICTEGSMAGSYQQTPSWPASLQVTFWELFNARPVEPVVPEGFRCRAGQWKATCMEYIMKHLQSGSMYKVFTDQVRHLCIQKDFVCCHRVCSGIVPYTHVEKRRVQPPQGTRLRRACSSRRKRDMNPSCRSKAPVEP